MKKVIIPIICLFFAGSVFGVSVKGTITKADTASKAIAADSATRAHDATLADSAKAVRNVPNLTGPVTSVGNVTFIPTAIDWFEDFIGGTATSGNIGDKNWSDEVSGAGVTLSLTSGSTDIPGQYNINLGTTNAGRLALFPSVTSPAYTSHVITPLDNLEMKLFIPTLSTGTEEYTVRLGFGDVTSADFANGIYFEYSRVVSVNWQYCTAKASVRTKTASSTAVTAAVVKLGFRVSAASDTVEYYVDGTSIGTITTNLPTSPAAYTIMLQFIKTVGTTGSSFNIDYVRYYNPTVR